MTETCWTCSHGKNSTNPRVSVLCQLNPPEITHYGWNQPECSKNDKCSHWKSVAVDVPELHANPNDKRKPL